MSDALFSVKTSELSYPLICPIWTDLTFNFSTAKQRLCTRQDSTIIQSNMTTHISRSVSFLSMRHCCLCLTWVPNQSSRLLSYPFTTLPEPPHKSLSPPLFPSRWPFLWLHRKNYETKQGEVVCSFRFSSCFICWPVILVFHKTLWIRLHTHWWYFLTW